MLNTYIHPSPSKNSAFQSYLSQSDIVRQQNDWWTTVIPQDGRNFFWTGRSSWFKKQNKTKTKAIRRDGWKNVNGPRGSAGWNKISPSHHRCTGKHRERERQSKRCDEKWTKSIKGVACRIWVKWISETTNLRHGSIWQHWLTSEFPEHTPSPSHVLDLAWFPSPQDTEQAVHVLQVAHS